jgi:Na+-transporting methylmalonyl-CoA/oxaloacetate decarboxylase gamma subunit
VPSTNQFRAPEEYFRGVYVSFLFFSFLSHAMWQVKKSNGSFVPKKKRKKEKKSNGT